MRQVKARAARSTRHAHSGRRAKASSRGHEPRARRKREHDDLHGDDGEGALTRLHDTFAFRHPMLTLTMALIGFGAIAGVLAGGHVARAEVALENTIESTIAGAGFAVRGVTVTGNGRTSTEAASAALGVRAGGSIFALDPAAARGRLLQLPWVADAEVRRQYPDTIAVRLIEKRPFALWRNGDDLLLVERSGAVITKAGKETFRLPLLSGPGAPEAAAPFLDALTMYKTLSSRVRVIERLGARRWDLQLTGGITAKLPEEGWEAQLAELERLVGQDGLLDRDIEIIDLRYPDNYVLRLHNGDSRPIAPRQQRA